MDLDWLREAYCRTRKNGAVGVDGQTAADYEQDLEGHLQRLLDRAKSGMYRAPPVRRVHIPKAGSTTETRPIGIPTLQDKVLQRAVVMLLEPIYEADFHAGSYGFRPGRSAHQALESLWKQTMDQSGGWILDLRRAVRNIAHWRRLNRHRPIRHQQLTLCQKRRGHYAYYGITGNFSGLSAFREEVVCVWRKWLSRRNRKRRMTWPVLSRLSVIPWRRRVRFGRSIIAERSHDLRNRMR